MTRTNAVTPSPAGFVTTEETVGAWPVLGTRYRVPRWGQGTAVGTIGREGRGRGRRLKPGDDCKVGLTPPLHFPSLDAGPVEPRGVKGTSSGRNRPDFAGLGPATTRPTWQCAPICREILHPGAALTGGRRQPIGITDSVQLA
jgi:hypothetical protein